MYCDAMQKKKILRKLIFFVLLSDKTFVASICKGYKKLASNAAHSSMSMYICMYRRLLDVYINCYINKAKI